MEGTQLPHGHPEQAGRYWRPEWGQAFNPRSAWSPHHVIPSGEHNGAVPAHPAHAFAYRCHMHPNDQRNGIWLRRLHGPLKDGTDDLQAYFDHGSSTERAWAGRAMHWNYDGRYSVKVSAAMTPVAVLPSVICRAHGSTLGGNAIHTKITNELTSGHIPGIPSGRPGR